MVIDSHPHALIFNKQLQNHFPQPKARVFLEEKVHAERVFIHEKLALL